MGAGWGVVCKVIFMSNPTYVELSLSCRCVGVLTIKEMRWELGNRISKLNENKLEENVNYEKIFNGTVYEKL